jgi:hypothetical protein
MKKLIIAAASLGLAAFSSLGQGYFYFDNSANYGDNSLLPTIDAAGGGYGEGNTGQVIGSDPTFATPNYDITYFWLTGTTYSGQHLDPLTFMALGAQQGVSARFDGPTGQTTIGSGLNISPGAGIVEAGLQQPTGATGSPDGTLITVELVAFYDPTGSGLLPVHDQFGNYYGNIGWSQLETVRLATAGDNNVADISSIPAFTVTAIIPEPSILALFGVGAAVAFARRRKNRV